RGRPGLRLARRSGRLAAAEAALQHLRPDGGFLQDDAAQSGFGGPRREEQRPAAERRAGAVPHGDPAAELPRAATTASSLPARRAELTALEKHTLAVHRRSGAANRTDAST